MHLSGGAGLSLTVNDSGALRRFDCGPISLALFIGNGLEGGPANLYLRTLDEPRVAVPLLGPRSASRLRSGAQGSGAAGRLAADGCCGDLEYTIGLVLVQSLPVWFWHLRITNRGARPRRLDLCYAQDLALAPYGAVRMNEYYVSQYVDHTPLSDARRGFVLASRQNQAVDGRYPWSLIGSLRTASSFATDALQFYGLSGRRGDPPAGLVAELPQRRLQHEHSMVVLRDAPLQLAPGESAPAGFFGAFVADHPEATSEADLARLPAILALPEADPASISEVSCALPQRLGGEGDGASAAGSLFDRAPLLETTELGEPRLRELFPPPWRHPERGADGALLSFFHAADRHVVLHAKELRVLRPHGQLLRSGLHLTPDETGLTSTVWMSGIFHSMLTQGHVSINRALSTVRSYLSLFRSHGLRLFAWIDGRWELLQLPSAFEMAPEACRWIYRSGHREIEVCAAAGGTADAMRLGVKVQGGEPLRLLCSLHVALNEDDGSLDGAVRWRRDGEAVVLEPRADRELGRRFPAGAFRLVPAPHTHIEQVGGDELLFIDGRSRAQPYLVVQFAPSAALELELRGELLTQQNPVPPTPERAAPLRLPGGESLVNSLQLQAPPGSPLAGPVAALGELAPWLAQNALVHYLSPRGLEQFSGGGWGTRDVCQGPVELLLALDRGAALRDLLLRVLAAQNPDGDWPQWFMFFERERGIRAGDSHGDVVFWPLLVLGQYLLATGDARVLEEPVRYFDPHGAAAGEARPVWEHAQRALALAQRRVIPGTSLAAYGHGDWNDALQPADPRLREQLCSAWTVTLHHQVLTTLARALRAVGRAPDAVPLEHAAQRVRDDFGRVLLADGVLAGYALFATDGNVRHLLHPGDAMTGVHYSALAMIHAILEDLLSPAQAREHLRLIDSHLSGPDGLRLFDRPMAYHGGPQRLFQRAESAAYFGREIGLMYVHAHLRFAQALAHMGEAERFFHALRQANPIGLRALVPSATPRQANCYYSSSDAAFSDRYEACAEYGRIARGTVALEGGWRVYSSGAGIAFGLIVRRLLGLDLQAGQWRLDPVMPAALDGLRVETRLRGRRLQLEYRVGARGCGVQAVRVDGRPVGFAREHNPHRPGAALIDLEALPPPSPERPMRVQVQLG